MEMVQLTQNNLADEHICCAISDRKCQSGVAMKKMMIGNKIPAGYVFKKREGRGKVFAEYCPIEISLLPVHAPGFTALNCFWVSGQYKGQGYAHTLMQQCLNDSRHTEGIVVITANKKKPYLTDKTFFQHYGFVTCDSAPPYFELLVYKHNLQAADPYFFADAKRNNIANSPGIVVYYSNQCPFTDYYTNSVFAPLAKAHNIAFRAVNIADRSDTEQLPCAFNIYSVFLNGQFVTHEILNEKKINQLLSSISVDSGRQVVPIQP